MKLSRAVYALIALAIFSFAILTGSSMSSNSKVHSIVSSQKTKPVVAALEAAQTETSLVITNNTKRATQVFVVPSAGMEDVDVSLVNGFNFNVTMTMQDGGGWVVSNTNKAITQIVPKPAGQNTGNPGVYPTNCTDCIQLVGSPVCPGFPTNPACQPSRICDAQRAVSQNGGKVIISLQPN